MKIFALLTMLGMVTYYSIQVLPKPEKKVAKVKRDRPEFMIVHKGIKPQNCNLAYHNKGEVVRPSLMQIHDYLKWNDGKYYFAVSIGIDKFLLIATDISKSDCDKEELALAYRFAKYCKSKDKVVAPEVVDNGPTYTALELQHMKTWDLEAKSAKEYIGQLENTLAKQSSQIRNYSQQIRNLYSSSYDYDRNSHKRRCTLSHVHTASCNRTSGSSSRGRNGTQISRLENMKSNLQRQYQKTQELLRKKQADYRKAMNEYTALKNK